MISPQTIKIVKSTAPFLAEHGEALTKYFYQHMFEKNPEVIPFFNTSNQDGTQQKALAAAITAYAANIDNLEVLSSAIDLITQKHVSLQVKAEHYPIVGENLLIAIRHILEDAASDDIINAWAEAYQFLADLLIKTEAGIYSANATKPGGWEGFKSFKVIKKVPESDVVTSFYLAPVDGTPVPNFKPGQYITLRLPTNDNSTTMRNYSLSHGMNEDWIRISVKREEAANDDGRPGYVSNLLHSSIQVGDHIEVAPPCGEFVYTERRAAERPLVFMAGGIGITPILTMLQSALANSDDQKVILIFAALNKNTQAFLSEIEALKRSYPNFIIHHRYSGEEQEAVANQQDCSLGFIDEGLIRNFVDDLDADYYFCGPKPFMVNIHQILVQNEVPQSQINFEFFGPREALEAS